MGEGICYISREVISELLPNPLPKLPLPAPETYQMTAHLHNPPCGSQCPDVFVHFAVFPALDVKTCQQIPYVLDRHFARRVIGQRTQELTCGIGRCGQISMKDHCKIGQGVKFVTRPLKRVRCHTRNSR